MLRAGAMDFITKSVGVDEMLKAIRMVSAGDYYVTPEVATGLRLILLTILGSYATNCLGARCISPRCSQKVRK
jgi:DNA-binding NarL/FixJ family response regulator